LTYKDPKLLGYLEQNIKCLPLWVCLKAKSKDSNWYMDSGCSNHMTGDKDQFIFLKPKDGGNVTFGNNSKEEIEGIGTISNKSSTTIENICYVSGLKHNLLSISQLCDKDFRVILESTHCVVISIITNTSKFIGFRHDNVYIAHLNNLHAQDV
ncbi:hypothetical protein CFOL_v3_25556, partial [Cephalotus follicularis]